LGTDADDPDSHVNLGVALQEAGRHEQAADAYRSAAALRPHHASTFYNLGSALLQMDRQDEAVEAFEQALRLRPDHAQTLNNLGQVRKNQGQLDEAEACYRRALETDPKHAAAHLNLGIVQMMRGDYAEGLQRFEWRWETPVLKPLQKRFRRPPWDGSPIDGQTILVHHEQGLGDCIQFIRYAGELKDRGARVIALVPRPLRRLLGELQGVDEFVNPVPPSQPFDVHAATMSLPRLLGTRVETIPAPCPYLAAEEQLVTRWRGRLDQLKELKVGLCWRGRPEHHDDKHRSVGLDRLAPMFDLPGVSWVSLHKEEAAAAEAADRGLGEKILSFAGEIDLGPDAFVDTAAVMANLDLVVTVDTALAHLAGALGRPTFLLLHWPPDWRWLLDRGDSPWYPTMRLFRQKVRGRWEPVVEDLVSALRGQIDS
ncbi:MAG: tetratricopeptide repeat-containing glycosyltransferase family protein, partial [Phycisphaerae bacterium]|nr:tetratricopeptide repeat-containing glycosyltransferase family protein [Phycisphaerae bacterium]